MDNFQLGDKTFTSRLITGTGKFSNKSLISQILKTSGSEIITVALRRIDPTIEEENILNFIPDNVTLLPNTSGARNAKEAIKIAIIAREAGYGKFIKIEVINDMKYLMPDNEETIKATEFLSKEGFITLPYMMPDLITAKKLVNVGASAVMPLGSMIGSNKGLKMKYIIKLLIDNIDMPIIVDAGIGRPSEACEAMELGADAVLVNTAIATAGDPVKISNAFGLSVKAGRMAHLSEIAESSEVAKASSPLTGFLFE